MEDEGLVEKAKRMANSLFLEKRANCAEAVFRAIHEIVENDLPSEACGLIAGLMALALVYGRGNPYEKSLQEHRGQLWRTYSLYNQLPHRFQKKFGTLECWDLTKDHVYGTKKCREFCEGIITETAGMVMELMLEAKEHGLHFEFKESLLSQAADVTGLSIEELVGYKTRAEPFPLKAK
jgi:hypothetical protein